jgi:anti-sigma regulatory factor (Ser/Thr protein kinase)
VRARVTLRIHGGEEVVRPLRSILEAFARLAGLQEGEAAEVVLAVHEALANVVRHGYGGDCSGRVTVRLRGGPGELEVLLVDACDPVPPEAICARAWDDGDPGGMGVPLIRKVMDVVDHRPRPGRGNVIRLLRRRRDSATEANGC